VPEDSPFYHCPMCGFEFDRSTAACDHGCPVSSMCNLVRCPGCDYEFSETRNPVSWFRRIFQNKTNGSDCRVVPMTGIEPGRAARVKVMSHHKTRRNSLAAFGLVPGSEVTVIQHRPACVIRIGETELALETSIASDIFVEPVDAHKASHPEPSAAT